MMKRREEEFIKKEIELGKVLEKVYLSTLEINILSYGGKDINYCFKCDKWYKNGERYSRNCPKCNDESKNSSFLNERPGAKLSHSSLLFLLNKVDENSFEIAKIISTVNINREEKSIVTDWELLAYTTLDINNLKEIGIINTKRKNKIGYSKLSDVSNLVSVPREFEGSTRTVVSGKLPDKVLRRLGLLNLFEKKVPSSDNNIVYLHSNGIRSIIELAKNHETLEKLDKLNFTNLIEEVFSYGSIESSIIGRKGKKLNEIIKVPKSFVGIASGMNQRGIRQLERMTELDKGPSKQLMDELLDSFPSNYELETLITNINDVLSLGINGITFNSSVKYLLDVNRRQAISPIQSIGIWKDYLSMSANMFEKFSKYPKSLKLYHDLCSRDYQLVKDEFRDNNIANRAKMLEPLSIENDEYKIIFPTTSKDLVDESNSLNHCVKSYADRVANGQTNVAFLRRKDNINKPLYTIEFRDSRVTQFKGFGNSKPTGKHVDEIMNKFKNRLNQMAI